MGVVAGYLDAAGLLIGGSAAAAARPCSSRLIIVDLLLEMIPFLLLPQSSVANRSRLSSGSVSFKVALPVTSQFYAGLVLASVGCGYGCVVVRVVCWDDSPA